MSNQSRRPYILIFLTFFPRSHFCLLFYILVDRIISFSPSRRFAYFVCFGGFREKEVRLSSDCQYRLARYFFSINRVGNACVSSHRLPLLAHEIREGKPFCIQMTILKNTCLLSKQVIHSMRHINFLHEKTEFFFVRCCFPFSTKLKKTR